MITNIPFFNYQLLFDQHKEQLTNIFQDVSSRGAFIMQDDLINFEERLAKYTCAKYALGVGNATDALQLLLKAGDIGVGDEVIFCSHTMVATASAVAFTGATPIPVEAKEDHLIDPKSIKDAITSRTRAIIPTQLNGRIASMDEIVNIAKEHDLQIFEDSAQALGAKFKGQSAGTFGLGGCISFYPAKTLGCFGDGGAVITNDENIYNKIKLMRDHGRGEDGNVSVWGFNSRLDNLQSAILNYFLNSYDQTVERRRNIARLYHERLKGISEIVLPPAPDSDTVHFDIFQNYEIQAEKRDKLREFLFENGIGTIIQWGGRAVHEYKDLGFTQSLPYTEHLIKKILLLPLNMFVTDDEIDYICDNIARFYNV